MNKKAADFLQCRRFCVFDGKRISFVKPHELPSDNSTIGLIRDGILYLYVPVTKAVPDDAQAAIEQLDRALGKAGKSLKVGLGVKCFHTWQDELRWEPLLRYKTIDKALQSLQTAKRAA